MEISSQNNQFIFNNPQGFVDKRLTNEFNKLMKKNFIPYESVVEYLSSCIKEIVFPGMSYDNVTQTLRRGKKVNWKDAKSVFDTFTRELDKISFSI